jgi:outer membrane autotransporter barrel domain
MKTLMPETPCKTGTPILPGTRFRVIALFACLLLLPTSAWADNEIVTYPGDSLNHIFVGGAGYTNALAPTTDGSNNNQVTVNDVFPSPPEFVFGGYNNSGASTGNTVTLNLGADVTFAVFGGFATSGGSATGNTVIINSGATVTNVYGGYTEGAGSASGNTVILNSGATVTDVYGGRLASGTGTTADNNTVIFHSGAIVNGNVYGGCKINSPIGTGNTLELRGAGQSIGGDLGGFQNFNFYLPSTLVANDTMLTVGGTATITGATVNVGIDGASSPLAVGDRVVLINATTLTGTPANAATNGQGMQGLSLLYDFALSQDTNNLYATVIPGGVQENPQLKALLEGQTASAAFLGQSAELVAGQGMYSALAAARRANGGAFTFGTMSGGTSRYNSGSHVDADGFSLMAGLGWNFALDNENGGKNGNLLIAPFFEAGWGGYDSHNSFRDHASVKGDGDINYYGGGLLARYDSPVNIYVDASFRLGRVETDFSSKDIRNAITGETADYETDAAYYGAHIGLGYLWNITEPMTLDIYTKYLWTRQEGDSVSMAGERYTFNDIDSHRWRTGARLSYDAGLDNGAVFTPYIGAAFDYEFDSKAKGNVNGRSIESPDIKGATGMGELGLAFKPSASSGLSLDLGVQGYTGVR